MAEEDDQCVAELARLFTATREFMDGTAGPIERLIEEKPVSDQDMKGRPFLLPADRCGPTLARGRIA
jgi:hypothetical protein